MILNTIDIGRRVSKILLFAVVFLLGTSLAYAQGGADGVGNGTDAGGKKVDLNVVQVDEESIKPLLKPNGKPLLINFWATWCEPCREEFPELIGIDKDYEGKIDFLIISLDDPVEINRDVTKFLGEMGSTMKPYLLRTLDETAVIGSISKDWQGGLPFTVLYDSDGGIKYARQGKIKEPVIRGLLEQMISKPSNVTVTELVKVINGRYQEAEFYYRNNWMKLRDEAIKRGYIESYELMIGKPGESQEFDIILITRFSDRREYDLAESRFRDLIKEMFPVGPTRFNDLNPDDFRKSFAVKIASSMGSN
ncbi:MAG: TlpA family protein disulfide reductase [Acidobacteria bacterium]|nr:MAG: TlpA family protein disulfide reductase [Acidobacteriota bacterium]REJ99223.1 MAG: TlpA family protein disulfide reductase [Acidobacteriota bacterium]REK16056.1 MAG: TlpA family protein disulfide reductase [Acidobacteriota bacterium]REK43737.1 MAG: TlpA family protein disulfide reductase [Acidobacteriota bacterium]